jgi:hypothetical protein
LEVGGRAHVSLRGRLGELLPWPFLGVVVLLVILIFLTPNLLSNGAPTAGSLPTEAELIVDRVAGSNVTHLYVKSLGTVRYTDIDISLSKNLSWPIHGPQSVTWRNATQWNDSLAAGLDSWKNPFAVNVSAIYVDATGASVEYAGAYAFNVSADTLTAVPLTPESPYVPPTSISSLPLFILLTSHALRNGS